MLSRLVYRSKAVARLSPPELQKLTLQSQARNSREAITGLMLYDNNRFFQWLEGPPANVDRLMTAIRNDTRHTDIEVLSQQATGARTFGDWSMKLATPGPQAAALAKDTIEPPREVLETLRKAPEAAPVLLVKLSATAAATQERARQATDALAAEPLQNKTASILKSVMLSTVIPQLAGTRGIPARSRPEPTSEARAVELADLLISADPGAAIELIHEMRSGDDPVGHLYAALFEPAARTLGDLWSEDNCSELDVTIGLCRLQTAMRLLGARTAAPVKPGKLRPVVLVAPEPGELHRLGAAMDSDVLWDAGWAPHCEYPTDNADLQGMVAATWVDVLDLSLSTAFRRDDWLPRITETITQARAASRNPALVVMVGGRVFFEAGRAARLVGANAAVRTAANVDQAILQSLASVSQTETLEMVPTPS
jgi:hypothetical protein